MKKVKQCPECGWYNDPRVSDCVKCGASLEEAIIIEVEDHLERAEIVKEEPQGAESNKVEEKQAEESELIVCPDCGSENPAGSRSCSVCYSPLNNDRIVKNKDIVEKKAGPVIKKKTNLLLTHGSESFKIVCSENDTPFGRNEMRTIIEPSKENYYSREHVYFYIKDGIIYARDDHSVNGTFYNQMKMIYRVPYQLTDGDTITIYDISFKVSYVD